VVEQERPDVLAIDSPYLAAASAVSVPRAHFGVRTFVWHADFIDTYLAGPLRERVGTSASRTLTEPLWAWVRAISRRCDATFIAGRCMEEKLLSHGLERLVYLPFGIDRSIFHAGAAGGGEPALRERLLGPTHPEGALLVGVGRLAVEKRWDVVLDAFVKLWHERDAVLVLYGDGPERVALEARARGRDDVRFMGFETDRGKLAAALASAAKSPG